MIQHFIKSALHNTNPKFRGQKMKKTILAVALAAASTTAFADTSLSGHVNYKLGDLEEFNANEDITVNDAVTSQSRFRFKSSIENNGLTYGTRIEFGITDGGPTNLRYNEFTIKGGFGKLYLGRGSESGDGATEHDFSGTYLGNGSAYDSWEGAGVAQIDGGRDQRLRYDTPKLGGIATISLDYDNADDTGIAINLGGSNWKAGLYTESKEAANSDEFGYSIAGIFGGFTISIQGGEAERGAAPDLEYAKYIVGYKSGPYSIAFDMGTNEQGSAVDHETSGLTFVYRPTKGVELYAGLRSTDDEDATPSLAGGADSADGFLVGGRVKF
jgi:hypothetical protein